MHRESFMKTGVPDKDLIHEVVFSIKRKGLDELKQIVEEQLYEPTHHRFQRYLSWDEVKDLTSNPASTEHVKQHLLSVGIQVHWVCSSGNYLRANATLVEWERLLSTQFFVWHKRDESSGRHTGTGHVYAEDYSLGVELESHVEALFNVKDPPVTLHSHARVLSAGNSSDLSRNLAGSGSAVTPSVLAKLYRHSGSGHPEHKQSVFVTSDEYMSSTDLTAFQNRHGLLQQGAEALGGHQISSPSVCSTAVQSSSYNCFEGNLDVQYLMGVAQKSRTIFHYVGDSNPFVTYLTEVSGQVSPALVHSISWGSTEQAVSSTVMSAFCNEALSLAARGVTIVVSSGDNGAPGTAFSASGACSSSTCSADSSSGINTAAWKGKGSWSGTGYFPSFPATCPYVTSVGGTMGSESNLEEIAVQSDSCIYSGSSTGGVITSGGGFSTFFARPDWQNKATERYFSGLAQQPAAGFNQYGRGIPDVSVVAVRYAVQVGGNGYHLYGTSASAPVIAGFITLVNALRTQKNMSSIGWINKALYNESISSMFSDVSVGNNKCCSNNYCSGSACCASGFECAKGWDPVTGWGSVNYPAFASIFSLKVADIPDRGWLGWFDFKVDNVPVWVIVACAILACCICASIRAMRFRSPKRTRARTLQGNADQSRNRSRSRGEPTSTDGERRAIGSVDSLGDDGDIGRERAVSVATEGGGHSTPVPAETLRMSFQQKLPLRLASPVDSSAPVVPPVLASAPYPPGPENRPLRANSAHKAAQIQDEESCPYCGLIISDPIRLVLHVEDCERHPYFPYKV